MSDDPRSTPHPAPQDDAPTGQLRSQAGLTIQVVGETNPGRVRPGNEDNLIHEDPSTPQARAQGTLLVVSDGMGGHAAGEVASEIAVNTIHSAYYRTRGMPVAEAVRDAIMAANSAIYDAAQRNMERAGMGCTVVVLVVQGADLTIGHVGDSRAYLIRGGHATQLTLDHSWVAMQVHEGILTPEQAEHHPNRSVLMRALGRQPSVEVDLSARKLQSGDILLVCSDGLTGMVTDAEIAEYATRVPPQQLPHQLIELANSRGAPDNVTVLIGAISGTPTAAQAAGIVAPAAAPDPNSTTTILAAPHDARTPRMEPPPGDTPTDRNLQRPPADATIPMGLPIASPQHGPTSTPAPASAPRQTGPRPAAAPRQTGPRPVAAPAAAGVPLGKPVVVARNSVIQADGAGSKPRRGRGQWIAGAVAAFGLAGALVLLSVFQLTRETPGAASTASAPATSAPVAAAPVAAAPAAAPPQQAAPAPTPAQAVPNPPANPALLPPAPAAATPLPTSVAPQAAAIATAIANKPALATPASSPGATSQIPTQAVPTIPSIRGIFGTAIPTPTPGQRTGEAPATASDAPTEAGPGGASAATTDPSADESQPAAEPTSVAGAAPGPASDGQRGSDLCTRGALIAPGIAARAGCKPNNSNDSGR